MNIIVKRVQNCTSKKSGKDFQICQGADTENNPIKFFAPVDCYSVGDKVELYVDTDWNFMARISSRKRA